MVALVTWFALSTGKGPPQAALTAVPLTSYPGEEKQPTFSPDDNQVAFSWNGEKQDNFDIYVKLIGSGTQMRLTTAPEADYYPSWSPDGSSIAFLRERPGGKAPPVCSCRGVRGEETSAWMKVVVAEPAPGRSAFREVREKGLPRGRKAHF